MSNWRKIRNYVIQINLTNL